jgi:peptidyl-tRNA hydrolase, PTH1 family
MKLIVGLGNPGKEYSRTRHNIGFRVLDTLAAKLGTAFERQKFKAEYADGDLNGEKLLLIKPQTFMNLSGEAVLNFSGFYKSAITDLLVVLDEVALPVGSLRLRRGGSDGGHNGLKNITLRLGSKEYARLRVGVGGRESGAQHPPADLAGHVLGRFSAGEETLLDQAVPKAVEICGVWAIDGVEKAMNRFNAQPEAKAKQKPLGQGTPDGQSKPEDGKK